MASPNFAGSIARRIGDGLTEELHKQVVRTLDFPAATAIVLAGLSIASAQFLGALALSANVGPDELADTFMRHLREALRIRTDQPTEELKH